MLLRRALLRELARGKWSLAAAIFGLSVAVASVTTVHLLNARAEQNLDALQPFELLGTIARRENGAKIALADYVELQNRLAKGQAPGVDALIPLIEGQVGSGWRLLGIDWVAMLGRRANASAAAEAEWARLMTEKSVLVPEGTADDKRAELEAQGLSVLGTHTGSDDRLLIADIATASELLGQDDISALALVPVPQRPSLLDLLDQLFVGLGAAYRSPIDQNLLGAGYIISTPDEELPVRRFAKSVMFNLGVLSVLCLLVAGFIAYQSAAGMALRRAPTLHRLRSLGVATSAISSYVHREAGVLGVLACLIGLPLGFGLATLVTELGGMGRLDRSLFNGWLVIKAVLVGIGVSLLGTSLAQPRTQAQPLGPLARTGFACVALGALILGPYLGLAGAFLVLGAVFVLVALSAWLQLNWVSRRRFAGLRLAGVRLITMQFVRGGASQGLRLFPVVSAFILALAVALAMQLMVASLQRDFDEFLDMRLDGELSLDADFEALPQSVTDAIAALPGVVSTRVSHTAQARVGALRTEARLIEYSAQELARYGAPIDTPVDAVLINGQLAREHEAGMVPVTGQKGQALLPVAHVFNDFGAPGPRLVMSRTVAEEYFEDAYIDAVRIHVAPGMETSVSSRIESEFDLVAQSTAELRERAMQTMEDTFWVSDALSMVALLVAVFGVFSGFNQLHLTRLRELRLLRAIGMSREQLLALLAGQSTALAVLVLPCSLLLALVMNWMLCQRVTPLAFGFSIGSHIDWWLMILFSSIGLSAVVTAALVPWRMTREASHVATTDETV